MSGHQATEGADAADDTPRTIGGFYDYSVEPPTPAALGT